MPQLNLLRPNEPDRTLQNAFACVSGLVLTAERGNREREREKERIDRERE